MAGKRGWRGMLVSCFAVLSLAGVFAHAGSTPKQDRAWKRYYNQQWGYCVSYPSRWVKEDAFEGAGIFVESGVKKYSKPLGEIDIGARSAASVTLIDNVQAHLEGLKKFERAQKLELLDKREMQLFGSSALFTKDRYYDPLERASWVDEIVFASRGQTLYRLELECRADQLTRFEPVFTYLVSTFQFDCDKKR